ncbi:MAG: hypothetical protein A2X12_02420 [Bacteroidetes bacterium GWE2_29_8]|nr:MAG: hypothetical protein A2X12_02420 [Bacteroidetes bacterium GWE2_29_8]OFY14622.1 MAG: hypothetical protein A2X02_06010 [Bacteroidetes bacterium GWF2_29_10]
MTRYWLFFLLSFFYINIFAQDPDIKFEDKYQDDYDDFREGFIGASYGVSIPYGLFGNKDAEKSLAGYAKIGRSYKINFGYDMTRNAGYTCRFMWAYNDIEKKKLIESFSNNPFINTKNNLTDINFRTNWYSGGFMAGAYAKVSKNKWIFDITGLVGFLKYKTPDMDIFINNSNSAELIEAKDIFALTGSVGLNIKYKITKLIILNLNCEGVYAEPVFNKYRGLKSSIIDYVNNTDGETKQQPIFNIINSIGIYFVID